MTFMIRERSCLELHRCCYILQENVFKVVCDQRKGLTLKMEIIWRFSLRLDFLSVYGGGMANDSIEIRGIIIPLCIYPQSSEVQEQVLFMINRSSTLEEVCLEGCGLKL